MSDKVVKRGEVHPAKYRKSGSLIGAMVTGLFLLLVVNACWLGTMIVTQNSILALFAFLVSGLVCSIGFAGYAISKFYTKASANLAFVRTGQGNVRRKGTPIKHGKVVLDGGCIVIPGLHEVVWVSMETMRVNIVKKGPESLLTNDNIRVEIDASFFIKVAPEIDDILNAARSLGFKMVDAEEVKRVVQEKLDSALRSIAATKPFMDLHTKRDDFLKTVLDILEGDLKQNGLTLESATLSRFEQASPEHFSKDNILDAQGAKKIAEVTQRALVEKNVIELDAKQAVKEKEVSTNEKIKALDLRNSSIEATQIRDVANVHNEKKKEEELFKIQQQQEVVERQIQMNLDIDRRKISKEQNIDQANIEREQTIEAARRDKHIIIIRKDQEQEQTQVAKEQAIETAEREKHRAIALKEAEKAAAEAESAKAQASKEKEEQEIITVQVTADARRNAEKELIHAKMEIEKEKIKDQTDADVKAYTHTKLSEAESIAAKKKGEATITRAEAERNARLMEAEGRKAIEMIPVEVDRERVSIEQQRVDVLRQELANKQEFSQAALEFEKAKLQIEAQKAFMIALADAMGKMFSTAKIEIFGDPSVVSKMMDPYLKAAGMGKMLEGFMSKTPKEAQDVMTNLVSGVSEFAKDFMASGDKEKHGSPKKEPNKRDASSKTES